MIYIWYIFSFVYWIYYYFLNVYNYEYEFLNSDFISVKIFFKCLLGWKVLIYKDIVE